MPDLSDPQTRQMFTFVALTWGIGVGVVLWNIVEDVVSVVRSRSPRRAPVERRFIEPCADGLHVYEDDGLACTTCKQVKDPIT